MTIISPSDIPSLSDDELQAMYEELGFTFVGNSVILDSFGANRIVLDRTRFMKPTSDDLKELSQTLNTQLGGSEEVYDLSDERAEIRTSRGRKRRIGRIFHHFEFKPRPVRYYLYLEVGCDDQCSDDGWIKVLQYVLCVVSILSLAVVVAVYLPATSKVIIANFATIVTSTCAGCAYIVGGIESNDQHHAWVRKYVAP